MLNLFEKLQKFVASPGSESLSFNPTSLHHGLSEPIDYLQSPRPTDRLRTSSA
jgi:hypothetical protein